MKERGIYVGRFQPFHKQHLRLVKEILGNFPDVDLTVGVPDWKGSLSPKMFLRGDEAVTVVQLSLRDAAIYGLYILKVEFQEEYDLKKIIYEVINKGEFSYLFSGSDRTLAATRSVVSEHKIPLTVIDLADDEGGVRGSNIRELMTKGDDKWKNFVTPSVAEFLEGHLIELLRSSS